MVGISCHNNHVPHPSQSGAPFAQSAKQQPGCVSPSATISAHADLKAVNAGNPGAGRGLLSGTFRTDIFCIEDVDGAPVYH